MREYICYYSCPNCKSPCCTDWESEANEIVTAVDKTDARRFFNNMKQCRYMKITRIEEYNRSNTFELLSIEVNGKKYDSISAALDAVFKGAKA
jgi:hypothetical protein